MSLTSRYCYKNCVLSVTSSVEGLKEGRARQNSWILTELETSDSSQIDVYNRLLIDQVKLGQPKLGTFLQLCVSHKIDKLHNLEPSSEMLSLSLQNTFCNMFARLSVYKVQKHQHKWNYVHVSV